MVLHTRVPHFFGRVNGWYGNIAAPPSIEGSTITTRDLIVDLFVWPDCTYKVLDMDELEEKKGLLGSPLIEKVCEARDRLARMIENGEAPFHREKRTSA